MTNGTGPTSRPWPLLRRKQTASRTRTGSTSGCGRRYRTSWVTSSGGPGPRWSELLREARILATPIGPAKQQTSAVAARRRSGSAGRSWPASSSTDWSTKGIWTPTGIGSGWRPPDDSVHSRPVGLAIAFGGQLLIEVVAAVVLGE